MIKLKMTKRIAGYSCLLLMVLLFMGCAEVVSIKECVVNKPYGF
jgi:hypothetical protein